MKTTRCFVALSISNEAVREVRKIIKQLQTADANVKWVEEENLHITLNFLGDVSPTETVNICRAVSRGADKVPEFDFELLGTGGFPNLDAPRTLWLGVGKGNEELCELQDAISQELIELGYPPDSRKKYHPHLTLGRIKRSNEQLENLTEILRQYTEHSAGVMPAMEVQIYASQLDRLGPKYSVIGRSALYQ